MTTFYPAETIRDGGGLRRVTRVPLGFDRRELRIETRRSIWRKTLETSATVVQVHEDGNGYTHALGLGTGCGDFSARVAESAARATEAAIVRQHDSVDIAGVLARALAHYQRAA